ncbi:MAG: signal transduction histidine kinase [Shewanella psychromarinicola]|jgi:signal transduction histidine kinase|uniref:sensor histidine kinase n=1 Tax=Shewanella psychromarinicola TaxID=2487742 RepID=UPI003EEA84CE
MSHEKWLVGGVFFTVAIILSLVAALTWSLGWTTLTIATLLFLILYPLAWLALKAYQFWCLSIMQLTTYTQMLREGEQNLRFKKQHKDNLLLELQNEISLLVHEKSDKNQKNKTVGTLLTNILDAWSVPVCLFDHKLQLRYRNNSMNEILQQPMLIGTYAKDLGFHLDENNFSHPIYDDKWQCQSIRYVQQGKDNWLFTAIDISQLLNKNQSTTQNNLIRVLGHELRNSLTPMSSLADTLLCSEVLNEAQTRKVLRRIQQRSDRLMTFIEQYSQLSQLPPAQAKWFDFSEILVEAKAMINENCEVQFQGNNQCYGDANQVAQVLINVLKNAQEACIEPSCKVNITLYSINNEQVIEITDNGPGFANLDNVLTPFYTTKTSGSGIGLSLCAEITRNHQGQISVSNMTEGGAKICMTWPSAK